MAIYHLSVKHGSRKQGKSAAAHANYIAREGNYAKGHYVEDFVHAESWNMPDWSAENAIDFWQAADAYERANGRLYTEIEIALPRELDQAQQLGLVRDFVSEQVGGEHPVTWAVHNRPALDGGMNPHAHIMLSERTLDGVERNPELFFKRANAAHPEKGGAAKDPAWNHRDKVEQLRQAWEATANRVLQRAGSEVSLDHRSLQAQGIDRAPEPKLGPDQTAMLHRGELTEDAERVVELRQGRAQQAALERQMAVVETRVARRQREAADAAPGAMDAATVADASSPTQERPSDGATPELAALASQPQQPDAASAPPTSASHPATPHAERRAETLSPEAAPGPDINWEDKPGAQAPPSRASPSELSWSQRLERLLPDDLTMLKSLWDSEYRRRFEQVKDKAQWVENKVREQMTRHQAKQRDHQAREPQAPRGFFRMRSKQQQFVEARQAWRQIGDALRERWRQLSDRLSRVEAYGRKETPPFGPSPGERLARKRLEIERPELAKKYHQAQAQEDERQAFIAARERRQDDADLTVVHPYLRAHGIGAYGVRCDAQTGDLVIPLQNVEGDFRASQRIDAEGQKRLPQVLPWRGYFHPVGQRQAGDPILIAEDYVTAASIYEATGRAVMAALTPENLQPVAEALRAKEPEALILICGDDDDHLGFGDKNVGRRHARDAAEAVGGRTAMPSFTTAERQQGMTDFNDMRQSRGLRRVQIYIEGSLRTLQEKKRQEQEARREQERERQRREPSRGMER